MSFLELSVIFFYLIENNFRRVNHHLLQIFIYQFLKKCIAFFKTRVFTDRENIKTHALVCN